MKCKMCEVLQPFRKRRKPLARVGCGELWGAGGPCPTQGQPLPRCHQRSRPAGAGRRIPVWPWVLPAGRTWTPWASALSHAALCSTVVRGGPGARAQLVSQLCHRSVSQDESESLWAEPSPSGVTALPLRVLPPARVLGAGASPHMGHPEQPGRAPASSGGPRGCTAGGRG